MGYNIGDVSGNAIGGGPDDWVFELDLSVPGNLTVSGDFDMTNIFGGASAGEVDSLVVTSITGGEFGSLSVDSDTGQWTFTVDYDAVMATGSDQVYYFEVIGTYDGGSTDDDNVTINILICFCEGTHIKTPEGSRKIEDLKTGDLVMTKDAGPQPVLWMGSRTIGPAELKLSPGLRPIRIAKGALTNGKPNRDLRVSPNHQILLNTWQSQLLFGEAEVLVPAKALIDDHAVVVDEQAQTVTYYHLMLEQHHILMSEGAETESFYPGPVSLKLLAPEFRHQLLTKFPELAQDDGYGPPVRPSLSLWEGEVLWEVAGKGTDRPKVEDAA